MRLRSKLFFSYLLPLAAVIIVLAVSVRGIAVRAAQSHMGSMMGDMMSGMADDIEAAMTRGLTEALLIGTAFGVVVALAASYLIARRLGLTAERLAYAAHRIADGRYGERVSYPEGDEIGEFVTSFNQMAERLENTEALRRELLGTISHELRTPLSNIQGYMEGLMDGVIPAEPETYQLVHDEAGRLTRLVAGIEGLSRAEAGVEQLHLESLDPVVVAEEAIRRMGPRIRENGLTLALDASQEWAGVLADRDKLLQILVNLLENACKYTPEGGAVTVSVRPLADRIRFAVSDTGIGIPTEELPYVFERFYRVDKSRSVAGGGLGIGLAVVRALVRRMGGAVTIDSEPGAGTTISFWLPRPEGA